MIFLKTKVLIFSIVFALLLSLCVSAKVDTYNISVPNNFTVAASGNDLEAVAKKLNLEQAVINEYFTQNGMLYLAVSDDAKTQVRLSALGDNFSSKVGDISHLNEDMLNEFITAIAGNHPTSIVENNDRKFVVIKNTLNDSGGTYTVTQYVTIANNKTYYLVCYNDGTDTADEISNIFNSFKITASNNSSSADENNEKSKKYSYHIVIAAISGVVFFGIAVLMIIGIIKPQKNINEESNNEN